MYRVWFEKKREEMPDLRVYGILRVGDIAYQFHHFTI